MKMSKTVFYLLAAILGGCVPIASIYPLYDEKDTLFEEKLLGNWVQDSNESSWQFTRQDPNSSQYQLLLSDDENHKGLFTCQLTKVSDRLFLDVTPAQPPWGAEDNNSIPWPYNAFFMIPVHTFIRVDSIEPNLVLCLLYENSMNKLFEKEPDAISHTTTNDRLVLTATTEQLRNFISKHATDENLFKEKMTLLKKSDKSCVSIPAEPNVAEPNSSSSKK